MLTRSEIESFETDGYLIKRKMLSPALMAGCLNIYWQSAPEGFSREHPQTWQGPIHQNAFTKEGVIHDGYDWKDTTLSNYPEGTQIIGDNPEIRYAVESLIEEDELSIWTRGIFGVLPGSPGRGFHIDGPRPDPFIGVTVLLSDVDEKSGAFTFIPRSHHIVKPLLADLEIKDFYDLERNGYKQATASPVEFTGKAGDVVFWDCMLLHCYTKNESKNIRLAMFTDFRYFRYV